MAAYFSPLCAQAGPHFHLRYGGAFRPSACNFPPPSPMEGPTKSKAHGESCGFRLLYLFRPPVMTAIDPCFPLPDGTPHRTKALYFLPSE